MSNRFDAVARGYDAFMRRTNMYKDDLILRALDLQGDEAVADLGGGTGHYAGLLSPLCRRVVVVDASEAMLAYVPALPNVAALHADLTRTGLPEGDFDTALMLDVIHHVRDQEAAIEEAYRILNGDGRLVVLDFDASCLSTRVLSCLERIFLPPVRYRTPEDMASLLTGVGFADISIERRGWQYLLTACVPGKHT